MLNRFRKSLATTATSFVLVVALLALDLAPLATAWAQTTTSFPDPAGSLASDLESSEAIFARLTAGISTLDQNPSYELAKTIVGPESLNALKIFDQRLAGTTRSTDAEVRRDLLRRRKYALYHHNRVLNAMAMADQVVRITGDESLRDSVFSATLDIIPDVNASGPYSAESEAQRRQLDDQGRPNAAVFLLPTTHSRETVTTADTRLVARQVADAQTRAGAQAQRGDRRHLYQSHLLKWRLVVDNEVALLRSYWLHMGRFIKAVPADNATALREVIDRRAITATEVREYFAALDQVRAQLRRDQTEGIYRTGQYGHNRRILAQRLNALRSDLARLRSNAPAFRLTDSQSRSLETGGFWQAWNTITDMRRFFYETPYTCVAAGRPLPDSNCRDFDATEQLFAAMAGMNPHHNRCQPDGRIIMDSRLQGLLRERYLRQMHPGREQILLNEFLSYLHRNRPEPAERIEDTDGCRTTAAPNGYNRKKLILDFFESIYAARFGESAETPLEDITPWELDGSSAFERARSAAISQEPLLFSDTLKPSYELTWGFYGEPQNRGFTITDSHIRAALEEMGETIRDNMEELAEIVVDSDYDRAIGKLIDRNPVLMWRRAAADWRYIGALAESYGALTRYRRAAAREQKYYFYGGMALVAVGIATAGAGFIVGGPTGAALITAGTVIGFAVGAHSTWQSIEAATEARTAYNAMRAQIFARIGDSTAQRRRAERELSQFYGEVTSAVISGVFTLADGIAVMRSVRLISDIRQVRRVLNTATRTRAMLPEPTVRFMGARFSALTMAERSAARQSQLIREILEQNASRSADDWLDDFIRRSRSRSASQYPSLEEALALGMRLHPEQAFGSQIAAALRSGHVFREHPAFNGFMNRMARFYRTLGGGTGRALRPDWVSRRAREMGFSNLSARGPVFGSADEVNRFFGPLLDDAVKAQFPNPSLWNGASQALGRTTWRALSDADMRAGSILRVFLDELQAVTDAPAHIVARRRLIAEALEAGGPSAEWWQIMRSAGSGEGGGFWRALRNSITGADGRLDRRLLGLRLQDWRYFWILTWGAVGITMTQQCTADTVVMIDEYESMNNAMMAPPPGVQSLVTTAESEAALPAQIGEIRMSTTQIDLITQDHITYQGFLREVREVREDMARCRGERGDVPDRCATESGRRQMLEQLQAYLEQTQSNIATAERNSRAGSPSYDNPSARYQAVVRAAGLD